MDASRKRADFPVRQHPRVVGVDLVEDLRHVELLQSAHQKIEIREGELHVLGVAHAVEGSLVELFREATRRRKRAGREITTIN